MPTSPTTTGTQQGDINAGLIQNGVYNPNIDVSKITPTVPVKLPDQPPTPDFNSILASTNTAQKTVDTNQQDILAKMKELEGQSQFKADQEQSAGVNENKQTLANLTAELNSVNNEATVASLNVDRQGRPTVLTSEATLEKGNIERDRTIKALRLSSSIQAIQGNLALANDQVTRAIALKYDPIKTQLDTLTKQLDFNYKTLTEAQKEKADAIKAANDKQLKQLEIKQKAEENWATTKNQALANGAPMAIVLKAETLQVGGNEDQARALLSPYTGTKAQDINNPSGSTGTKTLNAFHKSLGTWTKQKTETREQFANRLQALYPGIDSAPHPWTNPQGKQVMVTDIQRAVYEAYPDGYNSLLTTSGGFH